MGKGLLSFLVVIAFVVVGGLIFLLWGTSVYDRAVQLQEDVSAAWGNVQATYQRRADLVPNLVATVQGAAENEKEILTRVTEARAGIVRAETPEDLELMGKEINTAINLAFEAYPQIRSTENFSDLQSQLEGTENRINVARQRYNEVVRNYNAYTRGYFKSMALSFFGKGEDFSRRDGFESTQGAENAPSVRF